MEEIYMRIEEKDSVNGLVLADFVISEGFTLFNGLLGRNIEVGGPSMILFKKYYTRKKAGSVYVLNVALLLRIIDRIEFLEDSFIVMLEINLEGIDEEVFGQSISYSQLSKRDLFTYNFSFGGTNTIKGLSLPKSGNTFVKVRDVGQGSWNEVYVDERSRLVFDVGTHYSTKIERAIQMFGDRNDFYRNNRPGLIISHWDVDHYHFIKAMSNNTIKSLKFILCRAFAPTLTARIILVRLRGNSNLITVHPQHGIGEKGETPLFSLYNNDRFTIFNSGETRSRNKEGISMLIRNSNNSILLPGDQHYNQFNCFVNLQYLNYRHIHHLVVPHHGGNAGPYKYKLTSKVRKGDAVISVGKNSYGHPFEKVIHSLRQDSFNVSRTDIRKSDITIHL
jgi:hypothetical protein